MSAALDTGPIIEVYKGEHLQLHTRMPLDQIVVIGLERRTGRRVRPGDYRAFLVNVADSEELAGTPTLVNVRREFGHVILVGGRDGELSREMVSIRELLGPVVRQIITELDPDETYWGYCVSAPSIEHFPIARPIPTVEGTVDFYADEPAPSPLKVRRAAEPELPPFDLAQLGEGGPMLTGTGVILTAQTYDLLTRDLVLSEIMEVGGFLAGRAMRAAGRTDTYLLVVETILPAQHSGASGGLFTFTPDSFRDMNAQLDTMEGQRLVGWYHTHLFGATKEMGLSRTDLGLHFRTFQQPWQVAGLINYFRGRRVLRFYVRYGNTMTECPQWIINECDGYRRAGAALGA
jgi:hypothetical protein